MENGSGIKTKDKVRTPGAGTALLSPIKDENGKFTRWQEVDLSAYYTNETVDGVSYNPTSLFGYTSSYQGTQNANIIGKHAVSSKKYTTGNCGTATSGYIIETVQQIRNIEKFWTNNNYSCVGITVPASFKLYDNEGNLTSMFEAEDSAQMTSNYEQYYGRTVFKLVSDYYNLQKLTNTSKSSDPTASTSPWVPICNVDEEWAENEKYVYGTTKRPRMYYGFDGILEGNNKTIGGIAVGSYSGSCYGLFARISGGIVRNLIMDNAYVVSMCTYVGLVAGMSQHATFSNISFSRVKSYSLFSNATLYATASAGARIYMRTDNADGSGLLSGYMESCDVNTIGITTGDGAYSIEIVGNDGGSTGLLTGILCGESIVNNITLSGGNSNSWIRVTAQYAGGLIGTMKDESYAGSIEIDSMANMFVGYDSTTAAGGIVGYIASEEAELKYITFTAAVTGSGDGTADDFRYNFWDGRVYGKGVYLFAKETKPSFSTLNGTSVGKTGGLVGYNKGKRDSFASITGPLAALFL